MESPSKPIGPFLGEGAMQHQASQDGSLFKRIGRDAERPYRRVVPSPRPLRLLETRPLRALSEAGVVVITAGGGGIPVTIDAGGSYQSIEAVVDKDMTAEKVAESVAADVLLILTDVERVALDYGKPGQ